MADSDTKPKQRFVALRVKEVSLVDRPANEREFLVIKRAAPAEPQNEVTTDAEQEKTKMATPTEKTPAEIEAEKAKKGAGEKPGVQSGVAGEDDAARTSQKPTPVTPTTAAKSVAEQLTDAEKALAEAQAAVEALKGKAPPFKKKPGNAAEDAKDGGADDDEETKAKKSLEAEVQKSYSMNPKDMMIQMMCDDMVSRIYKLSSLASMDVEGLLNTAKAIGVPEATITKMQEVAKGKKQFSAERMAKFNSALKNLMEVAKDADPAKLTETLKLMLATLAGGAPLQTGDENNPKPPQATSSGADANGYAAQSAVKSLETQLVDVKKALDETKAELKALTEVHGTSKALTTEQPVAKGSESMWKGII